MQLSMIRGDTRTFNVVVTNPDGTPFDLTDCSLWFSVRTAFDAVGYVFQKTNPSGGISTVGDPALGLALVQLATGDTSGLPASEQRLVFDLQLATADSPPEIFTINRGPFIVQPDVTTET